MDPVAVRILHPEAAPRAGELEQALAGVRAGLADRLADAFHGAGADDVRIVAGPPDGVPFGRRLRTLVERERPAGLVVVGSGALVRARGADLAAFVAAAGAGRRVALANNHYSADAIAVACAGTLAHLPDLATDNELPRWLAESAGYEVRDLGRRRRLQVDVDGPLDALLAGIPWPRPADAALVRARLEALRRAAADPRGELLVAGRTSATVLRWLERRVAARVRALVEERGLRSGGGHNARPPRSVLGLVLDAQGPAALGSVVAQLADAALVDSRVLLAHRLGTDEGAWPVPEDRFASDLLLADRIADPWLRELTASAAAAPIPILLGGHSLVGPGLPAALATGRLGR